MDTNNPYTIFALSYRQWHHRMTPKGWEFKDACTGLTGLEFMNIFSLVMVLPLGLASSWLYVAIPLGCAAILYWLNHKTFSSYPAPTDYANYSDNVPALREFPLVYGYILFTLAFFVVCLYISVQRTA